MVKYIPTKRASKDVSVEQFWTMKEKIKPREVEKTKRRIQMDLSDRYRFKSFKKEIKKIDVSLAHYIDEIKVQPYTSTDDNMGSFFLDELELQNARCKAYYYRRFYQAVVDISQSLPLVLHNIDYIIDTIVDNIALPEAIHLPKKNKLEKVTISDESDEDDDEDNQEEGQKEEQGGEEAANQIGAEGAEAEVEEQDEGEGDDNEEEEDDDDLEDEAGAADSNNNKKMTVEEDPEVTKVRRRIMTPYMMQILPELIRDCQQFAFRPFVDKIFLRVTNLLDLNNLPLLQAIYKVLAYALKYFFPEIQQNFPEFLQMYMEKLFLHRNKHVRRFSSESFSYIIKKMKSNDRKDRVPTIFASMKQKCASLRTEAVTETVDEAYHELQQTYLKESISHMFFSCLSGIQRFMSHRGMDQYKEILELILADDSRNDVDIIEVFGMYLDTCFKHFTIEEQADQLCFNLADLIHATRVIIERFVPNTSNEIKATPSSFAAILQKLSAKLIDYIDHRNAANVTAASIPHIVAILDVLINYEQSNPDQLLKNGICGVIGRLFKRSFAEHSSTILSTPINAFLFDRLSVIETLEFFKLLVFPYDHKAEAVNEAYSFDSAIYEYCLVLSFRHVNRLFDSDESQSTLHSMFLMMIMIHERSVQSKPLVLRNAAELVNRAIADLPNLLDTCLNTTANHSSSYHAIFLFTKIAQCGAFEAADKSRMISIYLNMINKINVHLASGSELIHTADFAEDAFISEANLYAFDTQIVRKHDIESKIILETQRFSLLKSEMLVLVSTSPLDASLVANERAQISKYVENPHYLKNIAKFLKNTQTTLTLSNKDEQLFFFAMCRNLRSRFTETRLASLQVLDTFEKLSFIPTTVMISQEAVPSILKGEINLIQTLIEIQSLTPSIDNERTIKMELSRMKANVHAYPAEYHYALFNFCLGYAFVRFSLLWPIIKEITTHLVNLKKHPAIPYILWNLIAFYNYSLSPAYLEAHENDKSTAIESEESTASGFEALLRDYYLFEGDCIDVRLVFENIFKAANDVKRDAWTASDKSQMTLMLKQFLAEEHREISFKYDGQQNNREITTELDLVRQQMANQIRVNPHLYAKYALFLQLFINFISVRDIEKAHFYKIFLQLLRKNKDNIQALALDCILKFEKPELHKYQANLKQMTKKANLRREMLNLNLSKETNMIDESHRSELIPVIINLLYPHLFTKKGAHNKSKKGGEMQRNVIFEFFASLQKNELAYLVQLVFENFHLPTFAEAQVHSPHQQMDLLQLHLNSIAAFNVSLKNMMQKLGLLLAPFFNCIFNYLLTLFSSCQKLKVQLKAESRALSSTDDESTMRITKSVKKLQKQAIERYAEICRRYSNQLSGSKDFIREFLTIMDAKIVSLRDDTVTSVPGVLKILAIWAEDLLFFESFQTYTHLIPTLISLYSREKINVAIVQKVHQIFANLLRIDIATLSTRADQISLEDEAEEQENKSDTQDDDESEDDMEIEVEDVTVSKKVIRTTANSSKQQQLFDAQFAEFMASHFPDLLKNLYSYLEFNLAPSALVKRNKSKKIDSLCLSLIDYISGKIAKIEPQLAVNYLNYFSKFLDAASVKKLKDVASTSSVKSTADATNATAAASQSRSRSKRSDLSDKFTLFSQVLSISSHFLALNDDNHAFYKQFVNILPFAQTEDFKRHAVKCVTSLELPFLGQDIISVLNDMSIFERSMKQTLNYDKFLDAVYKVNTDYMSKWVVNDMRCVETYFLMLMSAFCDAEMSVRIAVNSSFSALFELIAQHESSIDADNMSVIKQYLFSKLLPFIAKELRKSKDEYVVKNLLAIFKRYLQFIPTVKEEGFFEDGASSASYVSMRRLIHTDEAQDFFECITHIQMNRRIKGMNILIKTVESLAEDQSGLWNIALPIVEWVILYKCQEIFKQTNRLKLTDATVSHYKLLLQAGLNSIGAIAKYLSVAKVKKILKKYIQFLSDKRFDQKVTIKVLGAVLETLSLPYDIVKEVNVEMEKLSDTKLEGTLLYDMVQKNREYVNPNQDLAEHQKDHVQREDGEEEIIPENEVQPYDLILDEKFDTTQSKAKWITNLEREKYSLKTEEDALSGQESEIANYYRFLRLQVFLPMKQLLFDSYQNAYNKHAKVSLETKRKDKSDEKIRIFMTIGLIRLLIKFPKEIFRLEFPKIVNKVVKNLKTKDNDERTFTRKVLLEIVRLTGPYFFHYILKELTFFLKDGWEAHILNFTVFTLLTELDIHKIPIGSLDYCHNDIFPLLVDEIFGKLNEEKDLGFTKIPEQKKNKANATFLLLAKNLDFRNVISFLAFTRQLLVENLDGSKNLGKFEEMFNFVLEGFVKNPSVQHSELIAVSYSLIKDALELIENSKKKERMHDTTIAEETNDKSKLRKHNLAKTYEISEATAQNKSMFQMIQDSKKKNKFKIGCSLSNFGLKLCLMGIKKSIFAPEHILNEVQFEQLIKVVVDCLKSTDNSMVISSLRIIRHVIARREAKSIRKGAIAAVLAIMEKLSSTDMEMISETFKLLNTIVDATPGALKNSQYKALLVFVKQFMELSDQCTEPLNTLRTIIEKKQIHEEVYDLINSRVRDIMIQSYAPTVNAVCKSTFLSFLVKYPISDAIMQSSINFLIKNTEYSYEQGRIVVYDLLKIIIRSFPDKVLAFFGEILFVSLLVNLIKEENAEIAEQIKSAQTLLLPRLSKEQKTNLISNNLQWITQHSNPKIQQSGFIGLKLFVEDNQDLSTKEDALRSEIRSIFDSREERMNVFWEIIKQKREKKEALKNNSEWRNIVDDEAEERENEDELKNDSLLNSVLEFVLAHNKYLSAQSLPNKLVFETSATVPRSKILICSIIQYVNFPNQLTSNFAMDCIMELTDTNYDRAKDAFENGKQVVVGVLPKLLKYLYFSKLKNNFIIHNTEHTHKFFIFALKFFLSCEQETIALSLFDNILKIFLKSYVKAYYNKSQIENIVALLLSVAQYVSKSESEELVNEVKDFMLRTDRPLEIALEVLIKVKSNDQNNKVTNTETVENAELALEELKKSVELNKFFQMYSKVKSNIETVKMERKQQQKSDLINNPEVAIERKKEQNIKKNKAHNNKFKNSKKSQNIGKKILKKD